MFSETKKSKITSLITNNSVYLATFFCIAISIVVFFIITEPQELAFNIKFLIQGEIYRLITFVFTHFSKNHLFSNVAAFTMAAVLAYQIELKKKLYFISFGLSIIAVLITVIIFFPDLIVAGLSFGIYTLFGTLSSQGGTFISKKMLMLLFGLVFAINMFVDLVLLSKAFEQTLLHFIGFLFGLSFILIPKKKKHIFQSTTARSNPL